MCPEKNTEKYTRQKNTVENIHGNEYTCTFFNTSYKERKHSLLENVPDSFLASLGCPKEHHITSVFVRTSTRKAQYVVLRVYFMRPENVVKFDSVRLCFAHIFILFFHTHIVSIFFVILPTFS